MTSLAVVAYPALSEDDHRWIEGIRARYDPLALRIAAHFTLVFPTEVAEAPVLAQSEILCGSASPFQHCFGGRRWLPTRSRAATMSACLLRKGNPRYARLRCSPSGR